MADKPQSFQNHARLDPLFHGFLGPLSFILLIAAVTNFVRNISWMSAFLAVASIWAVVATFKIRLYALKVQDRVIRLEERLRYQRLLPSDLQARTDDFTINQIVSLRFASDAELPALARKVLDEKLQDRKAIKQLIRVWKPDYLRA